MKEFGPLSLGLCLMMVMGGSLSGAGAPSDDGIEIGLQKQLFVDDEVVAKLKDVERVVKQPQRHANNPILVADRDWEGRGVSCSPVLYEAKKRLFHMYYVAFYKDGVMYMCYAKSTDGVHWEKPSLGLYEGPDGTKKNNIVLRGEGQQARPRYIYLDPEPASPDRKFAMLYCDNAPGLRDYVAYSPDGLHWKTVASLGDLRDAKGGEPTDHPRFLHLGQKWVKGELDHGYRGIWRIESNDLKTWGGGKWIVRREADDDENLEFYHASCNFSVRETYHGLHIGYYYPYHTDPAGKKTGANIRLAGTIDTALMVSRDTIDWARVKSKTPFFPVGKPGAWDAGMVFLTPPIVVDDRLWFYYGGWKNDHAAKENPAAVGMATLRLDGFACLKAKGGSGEKKTGFVVTKPFTLRGDQLEINADASRGGIRVDVLTGGHDPIEGLTAAACRAIGRDGLRQRVRWSGQGRLAGVKGKTIRLRFHLSGEAELYAFAIGE